MTVFPKLFQHAPAILGLEDDVALLDALAKLAKDRDIADAEALLDKAIAAIDDPATVNAFQAAGLADVRATLSGLFARIDGLKDEIPEKYRTLLRPLSAFAAGGEEDSGLVEWTLLDEKRDLDVTGEFKLGLGGSAKLAFEAGDKAKIAGKAVDKPLLRLSVDAGVNAKAAGSAPIQFVTVSGEAEGSLDVGFDCYFDAASSATPFGFAVAKRLPNLPNPFDFNGVWAAFRDPDLNLHALVYTFNGKAKVGVKAAVTAPGSFDDIAVEVKASIAAEASLNRTFQLTLSAAGDATNRQIAVLLTRGAETKKGITAGLSVGLDFAIPVARVHALVKKAVDEWDKVLAELTPYLSPGTLLQTKLNGLITKSAHKLIGDDSLRDAIANDLRTTIGIETSDDSQLVKWLSQKVESAVDSGAKDILERADLVRDEALGFLEGQLPSLRGEAGAALRDRISAEIEPLVKQAQERLIKELNDRIGADGKKLGEALGKAKVWSGARVNDLNEILKPLRELIEKYNKMLHEALDALGDAAKAKISADLQFEEQWLWGEEDQIAGAFLGDGAEAAKLFNQLTHGRLGDLVPLVHGTLKPPPQFDLDEDNSKVKVTAERKSSGKFTLVLFGIGSVTEWLVNGKATVLIDGAGNVHLDDEGRVKTRFKTKGEEREVSFVDAHTLRLVRVASQLEEELRSITVSVSIIDQDDKLALNELKAFIENIEKVGMVAEGTAVRAADQFSRWADTEKTIPANLAAKVRLDTKQVENLIRYDPSTRNVKLDESAKLQIIDRALQALKMVEVDEIKLLREGLGWIKEDFPSVRGDTVGKLLLHLIEHDHNPSNNSLNVHYRSGSHIVPAEISAVVSQRTRLNGLIDLIQSMGEIYVATPRTPSDPSGWTEGQYRDAQHKAAGGAATWLRSNGFLIWLSSEVHPVTAAFLKIVADLGGLKPGTGLALDISRKDGDGKIRETVTLS